MSVFEACAAQKACGRPQARSNFIEYIYIYIYIYTSGTRFFFLKQMLILDGQTYLIRRGTSVGVHPNQFRDKWMRESRFGDKKYFWDFGTLY